MLVHGSLKSAIHLMSGYFSLIPKAIRCMVCGGPVLMMCLIPDVPIYAERNFTLGLIQNLRASGIKKLPRIHTLIFSASPLFLFSFRKEALILSSFFLPINSL